MPKFYIAPLAPELNHCLLDEGQSHHLLRVLRLRQGEAVLLGDEQGVLYRACLDGVEGKLAKLLILSREADRAEPSLPVTVYQCLPKGDKLQSVIQKGVELGAESFVLVSSERCVVQWKKAEVESKLARFADIAKQAAMQSERGIIPQVRGLLSFDEALSDMKTKACPLMLYERAHPDQQPLSTIFEPRPASLACLIGPEGGFSPDEVARARAAGVPLVRLGNRILRTETAAGCFLSIAMFCSGNL